MTAREALTFIREQGVVLESARAAAPSLAEAIAGGRLQGSWWAHPQGRKIFAVTRSVRGSDEILVCRFVDCKITLVHRRLWPALVRLADRVPVDRLAKLREVHTESGRHRIEQTPFPDWVSPEVRVAAGRMSEEAALSQLGRWIHSLAPDGGRARISVRR